MRTLPQTKMPGEHTKNHGTNCTVALVAPLPRHLDSPSCRYNNSSDRKGVVRARLSRNQSDQRLAAYTKETLTM